MPDYKIMPDYKTMSDDNTMPDYKEVLARHFGYASFRKGQEEIIAALCSGRDALAVMPTGSGKSLCYQVPALLFEGLTLVISPLISLMKDQVAALTQAGVPAAYINSSLSQSQAQRAAQNAREGRYRILYVAPERLETPDFLDLCADVNIPFVAVDEAHCVSQWGQDFRPSYLGIGGFIARLRARPVVGAFTATATERVRQDIESMLRLNDPLTVATGFDRPNLRFEVLHPKNKQRALEDVLEGYAEQSGIVYCSTRKTVEAVCEALNAAGYAATRYHAGLSDEERRRNQEDFQHDTKRVMVATNAFGMGIDKSNVRFVVHFNMPGSIEAYYQEAGRAGRDGAAADCLLFHSLQDEFTARFLIDRTSEDSALDEEQLAAFKQQEHERLGLMVAYCNTTRCLRQELLGYFGDEELTEPCGNCSVCDGEYEERDITVQTRKILSCVSRMGGRFGVNMVVNVLRGDKKGRVFQFHLHQLPTYGILSDTPREQVQGMIAHLTAEGYLRQTNDRFPLLTLGSKARAALFEGESVVWRMPLAAPDAPGARKGERGASGGEHDVSGGRRGERRSKFADANAPIDEALLAALRRLRAEIAQKAHQPAYVVFSDAALLDMCRKHPLNEEEFLAVSGVGNFKLEKYGQAFLAVLRGEIAQDTEGDEGASPEKAGQPWSEEEDARLRLATQLGYGPPAIAQVHGRTVQAIEARMKKLGIPNTAK